MVSINRLLIVILVSIITSCEGDVSSGDIEKLITIRLNDNQKQIGAIREQIDDYKASHFSFRKVENLHKSVVSVIHRLDNRNSHYAVEEFNRFIKKSLPNATFSHDNFPSPVVDEETPVSLIKLQIVDIENLYLRNWEFWASDWILLNFDEAMPLIIPDKFLFEKGESITGRVVLARYETRPLNATVRINGVSIISENGVAYFELNEKDFKTVNGRVSLNAEIDIGELTKTHFEALTSVGVNH